MGFYGKKTQFSQNNQLEYQSIKEQILKEIGQRNISVEQKSIASILNNVGDVVLTITQMIVNAPENIKKTEFYHLYEMDKETFRQQMKPTVSSYKQLAKRVTQNKFFIINKFSIDQRLLFLNGSVYALSVLAASLTKGSFSKIRSVLTTSLLGYATGGLLFVPEIYNPIFSAKNGQKLDGKVQKNQQKQQGDHHF